MLMSGNKLSRKTGSIAAVHSDEQLLKSVLAASSDCIKVLNLEGMLVYMSDGGRLVMEVPAGTDIIGGIWTDLWGNPFKADAIMALDRARSGATGVFQGYAETYAGTKRYWDVRVTPMMGASGIPDHILVVSRDISHLKKVEQEREYLANELSHRLKNAFSMVQSVINQTLRRAASLDEGRAVLSGRIGALAAAQDILTRSTLDAVSITDVVTAALSPHDSSEGKITLSGEPVLISGRQGLGLSLALHELATNATKYGALSAGEGQVFVNWDVLDDGAFSFIWRETDGPAANFPTEQGFGTVLIRQVVATYFDGTATLEFPASGAVFSLFGKIGTADGAETPRAY